MEIKNIKKITPRFNYVITTADRGEIKKSGIIIPGEDGFKQGMCAALHPYQKVIAIGEFIKARENNILKEGQIVKINLTQFAKRKFEEDSIKDNIQNMNPIVEYNVPTITLNGIEHLILPDNAIDYVVEDYE